MGHPQGVGKQEIVFSQRSTTYLPPLRITPVMQASHHNNSGFLYLKEDAVRKSPHPAAAHFAMNKPEIAAGLQKLSQRYLLPRKQSARPGRIARCRTTHVLLSVGIGFRPRTLQRHFSTTPRTLLSPPCIAQAPHAPSRVPSRIAYIRRRAWLRRRCCSN
jgi:hypothetical protein